MTVRDRWHTADGQCTAVYGKGLRWLAVWTGPDGKRDSKAHADRAQAERHEAWMQAATDATRPPPTLLEQVRQLTSDGHGDVASIARELRDRIPGGHEERALVEALETLTVLALTMRGRAALPGKRRRSATQAAKDAQAAALRAQGKTYEEIADALGMSSKGSAHQAVSRGIAGLVAQHPAA